MKINVIKPTEPYGNVTFLDVDVSDIEDALQFKHSIDSMFGESIDVSVATEPQRKEVRRLLDTASGMGISLYLFFKMYPMSVPSMSKDIASAAITYLKYSIEKTREKIK